MNSFSSSNSESSGTAKLSVAEIMSKFGGSGHAPSSPPGGAKTAGKSTSSTTTAVTKNNTSYTTTSINNNNSNISSTISHNRNKESEAEMKSESASLIKLFDENMRLCDAANLGNLCGSLHSPLRVIAIAGSARQGKSTFMNLMAG